MRVRKAVGPLALVACAAAFSFGFLAACDFEAVGPQQTLWQGSLVPTPDFPALQGSVAAISHERARRTEVGIGVQGAPVGKSLMWKLREGTCAEPGDVVGTEEAYDILTVDEAGNVSDETVVHQVVLNTRRNYHASVREADGERRQVACGALTPR